MGWSSLRITKLYCKGSDCYFLLPFHCTCKDFECWWVWTDRWRMLSACSWWCASSRTVKPQGWTCADHRLPVWSCKGSGGCWYGHHRYMGVDHLQISQPITLNNEQIQLMFVTYNLSSPLLNGQYNFWIIPTTYLILSDNLIQIVIVTISNYVKAKEWSKLSLLHYCSCSLLVYSCRKTQIGFWKIILSWYRLLRDRE